MPRDDSNSQATSLCTADELIRFYADELADIPITRSKLERAIPAAIDAIYSNRDAGGNMHSAGAAAAVAALKAVR